MRVRTRVVQALIIIAIVAGRPAIFRAQTHPSPEQIARREIEDVWNKGIYDGEPLLAPQTTLHFRGQAVTLPPDGMLAVVKRWRAAFPDFHFAIEDTIVQGNKVVMRIPFTGTHLGSFWGLEPTGKKVSVTETLIFRIENGLIAEMWEDYDEFGMRMQLGLVKP
jgi:predicted ester cyclase